MRRIDLQGQTFGRWTVVGRAANTAQGQARWNCQCVCGTMRDLKSIVIRRAISQSCGCLKAEIVTARNTKHGHHTAGHTTPTYHTWCGMVARCANPAHHSYPRYGGRGITVCARWATFANFLADMGVKPPGASIDRVDVNTAYEPGNCRWATVKQQARNKRNNRMLTLKGETLCESEWCERLGMHPGTLSHRLHAGWTDEEALTTPVRQAEEPHLSDRNRP